MQSKTIGLLSITILKAILGRKHRGSPDAGLKGSLKTANTFLGDMYLWTASANACNNSGPRHIRSMFYMPFIVLSRADRPRVLTVILHLQMGSLTQESPFRPLFQNSSVCRFTLAPEAYKMGNGRL